MSAIRRWSTPRHSHGHRYRRRGRGVAHLSPVIHLPEGVLPDELPKHLRAARDPDGPLVFLGLPGPQARETPLRQTVHPLLVWTEMMTSASERVREAAHEPIGAKIKVAAGKLPSEYCVELET